MIPDPLYIFLTVCILGFSAVMGVLSLASFIRVRNRKLLMVGGGFWVMALKGAVLAAGVVGFLPFRQDAPLMVLDMGILAFLYLAAASR